MELDPNQLFALIKESQRDIAELKVLVKELPHVYRNWTLGGIIVAIVSGIALHSYLHPGEFSAAEKRMKQQSKTLDQMIKEATKLQEEARTLSSTQ